MGEKLGKRRVGNGTGVEPGRSRARRLLSNGPFSLNPLGFCLFVGWLVDLYVLFCFTSSAVEMLDGLSTFSQVDSCKPTAAAQILGGASHLAPQHLQGPF